MAKTQTGAISFGLVYIPVDLYAAVQDNGLSFNQLTRSGARVRYKKVAEDTGREVAGSEIVKGYQYDKDRYVTLSAAELESLKTEQDRNIQILSFTDPCAVSPAYCHKSYFVLPHKGGEKAFNLLRQAMLKENRAAVGKTVLGDKETTLLLVGAPDALLLVTLFYHDEIKALPKSVPQPEISESELDLACRLIESLDAPFAPEQYKDEYRERLKALLERKIEGREITAPKAAAKPAKITSLMDALQASLKAETGGRGKKLRKAG